MRYSMLFLLLISTSIYANESFVSSSSGVDGSNDGSSSSPYKTINYAISKAATGDVITVKAGTYRELVNVTKDGLTIQGEDGATVTGTDLATNWVDRGSNVYSSYLPEKPLQLFVDSKVQTKAKFPNQAVNENLFEFTTFEMSIEDTTVTSAELMQPDGYWDGATIWILVGERWVAMTGKISASSVGKLEISYLSANYEGEGIAYITNSKKAFDYEGEWSWQNDSLYYYTTAEISNLTVEVKTRETLFNVKNRDGVTIDNISGYAGNILMDGTDNSTIKNSDFTYLTEYHYIDKEATSWYSSYARSQWTNSSSYGLGIGIFGSNNIIDNCEVSWSAGDCITLYGENNVVKNSVIHDANYLGTDAAPIAIGGTGNKILNNEVYNGGRGVITALSAESFEIKQNRMYQCGLICWDVGVFYTFDTDAKGAEISYNWVSDATSDNPAATWGAHGIYLDNNSVDYNVHHNVIWNSKGDAIRFNSPATNLRAYNNTIFDSQDMTTYKHPDYNNEEGGCKFYNNYLDGDVLNKTFIENKNNISTTEDYLVDRDAENFKPSAGSPLIGASIAVDEAGVQAGDDIGAYSFTGEYWSVGPGSSEVVTAVQGFNYSTEAIVYPNPVVEYLSIINNGRFTHFQVIDTHSRVIMAGELENDTIDFSHLSSSVYTIVLIGDKEVKNFLIYKD